jgi:hypothetical protein
MRDLDWATRPRNTGLRHGDEGRWIEIFFGPTTLIGIDAQIEGLSRQPQL